MSQWVVSAKTNAVSAAKWVKEAKRIASGMTKDGVQRTIRDGYLVVARLLNGRRDVEVLDPPVSVRAIGIAGGVGSATYTLTTRYPVAGSRDVFLSSLDVTPPVPEPAQDLLPFVSEYFTIPQYPIGAVSPSSFLVYTTAAASFTGTPGGRYSSGVLGTELGPYENANGVLGYYPMSAARPWWVSMESYGRASGIRVTLAESFVMDTTGHRFFPVGIPEDNASRLYNAPKPAHTELAGVACGVVPVVDLSGADDDYGKMALFVTYTTLPVAPDTEATTAYELVAFPSTPQFEQQEFQSSPGSWIPAFCEGELVGRADGAFEMYGYYFTELRGEYINDDGDPGSYTFQMVTRFCLTVGPSRSPSWQVLQCCVTTGDGQREDARRVGSVFGQFLFPRCPSVFSSQGNTWAVTYLRETNGGDLALPWVDLYTGAARVASTSVAVSQNGVDVDVGKPSGGEVLRSELVGGTRYTQLIPLVNAPADFHRRSNVAMHADTPSLTGFTLFFYAGADFTEPAYWDTERGWGWWGWDTTLINQVPAFGGRPKGGLPRVSTFKLAAVDDTGVITSPPSLLIAAEYFPQVLAPITFVAVSGKVNFLAQISGLAVYLIGSPLTAKSELNNLYREK